MALPIVRLGDFTSHNGKVISASSTHLINGVGIARIGGRVTCPIPEHGINPIVEGMATYLIGGHMVALHGYHSACGCTLIASLITASYG